MTSNRVLVTDDDSSIQPFVATESPTGNMSIFYIVFYSNNFSGQVTVCRNTIIGIVSTKIQDCPK